MTQPVSLSGEVKGLTDRPRLPRIGKIRLGEKKVSAKGKEYPSPLDYFLCPPDVQAVYGAQPRELDVVFPIDDVRRIAPVAWKRYTTTRGKVCTSDGETAHRIVDEKKLAGIAEPTQADYDRAIADHTTEAWSMRDIPCPAKECTFAKDNSCKAVMNLQFMLPRVRGIGVWQLDTASVNSIIDVRGGIELTKRITGGRIAGVPLKLRVEPTTAFPDGRKKIVFTLKLFSPQSLEDVVAIARRPYEEPLIELPERSEIEEELYPHSRTQTTESAIGAHLDPHGEVIEGQVVTPHPTRSDGAAEAPTGTAAPSAAQPTDSNAARALDENIERAFGTLKTPEKERATWRKGYEGRELKLLDTLRREIERRAKAGAS